MLDGLNEPQRTAVTAGLGPVLVLAGPGSGKTRVLTHRIAYLIRERGVPASAILAVTFTNKAAGEMRRRVEELIGSKVRGLQIGTFHATCARLLRREGERIPYGSDYLIYDSDDQLAVVKQSMAELSIDNKRYNPRRVLGVISTAKNELQRPRDFRAYDYYTEMVGRVYERYQSILLDHNAMDFDDLLMQMVFLLRDDAEVLEKYQRFFEFVLVDEFQDTNTAQYELVRLLGAPQNNVLVVGDEDQGIYAFRGADYRNVLHFRQDYLDAQVILLEQNYRSTQIVLDAARSLIDKNTNRTPKALFTTRTGGDNLTLYEAYSEDTEAEYVIEQAERLYKKGYPHWGNFAVMYRTNAQSRALEEAFIHAGIPYRLVGGVGFYKRREVRDLLAFLRLVHNPNDGVSFDRVINVPRRGIGKKTQAEFQHWARNVCNDYQDAFNRIIEGSHTGLSGRVARLFTEFAHYMVRWQALAAEDRLIDLLDTIMSDVSYGYYASNDISDTPEQATERQENIQQLRGLLVDAEALGITLSEFLTEQALLSDVDSISEDEDAVTLMTLHAAKGLEFPVVFITGIEEGLLPHARSVDDPDGLEEERRLMYVGMTRAKDRLFLSYAFRRTTYGGSAPATASRFLKDLPMNLIDGAGTTLKAEADISRLRSDMRWEAQAKPTRKPGGRFSDKIVPFPGTTKKDDSQYNIGDRVYHKIHGAGVVLETKGSGDNEEITVAFKDKVRPVFAEFVTRLDRS